MSTIRSYAIALLLLTAAAALLVFTSSRSEATGAQTPTVSGSQQALNSAKPAVGLMRTAPQASDQMPARISDSKLLSGDVVDATLAKRADPSKPAWIVPATDGVSLCEVSPGLMTCAQTAVIATEGAAISVGGNAERALHVSGIVNDSVDSVILTFADGATRQLTVANNYFSYDALPAPVEVSWLGPNGPRSYKLPTLPR